MRQRRRTPPSSDTAISAGVLYAERPATEESSGLREKEKARQAQEGWRR